MTADQAERNLMNLLNHPELRLNFGEHTVLRQSLALLYDAAKEKEEDKKAEVVECPNLQAPLVSET